MARRARAGIRWRTPRAGARFGNLRQAAVRPLPGPLHRPGRTDRTRRRSPSTPRGTPRPGCPPSAPTSSGTPGPPTAGQGKALTFGPYAERWLVGPHPRSPHPRALPPPARPAHPPDLRPDAAAGHHAGPDARVALDDLHRPADPARPRLRAPADHPGPGRRTSCSRRNPCHIRGAGNFKRAHKIQPASLDELAAIVAAMPARYRVMVLLAAWCGLRFGELTELRRGDVDTKGGHPPRPPRRRARQRADHREEAQERRRHP